MRSYRSKIELDRLQPASSEYSYIDVHVRNTLFSLIPFELGRSRFCHKIGLEIMAPLLDKKVVIVGGSSGIGFGVAKAVLSEGGHVVICSSNADKVAAAAKRLDAGERVTAEVVDITNESSVNALFEKVGKYDHLVITVCYRTPWPSTRISDEVMSLSGRPGRR
jgi:hypothetical protein